MDYSTYNSHEKGCESLFKKTMEDSSFFGTPSAERVEKTT
jgi:hypothetical protein